MKIPSALILPLLLYFSACQEEPRAGQTEPLSKEDLGLKVIRAGDKPARAPGPKGTMVDLGNEEVKILYVAPGGPADDAGFQAGDIILAVDGRDIASEDDLAAALKTAAGKKVFFELRHDRALLTLALQTEDPRWLVISGDSFKGFLITRMQSEAKVKELSVGQKAGALKLPASTGDTFDLAALQGQPVALMFWGTFFEPSYAHLQALQKVCARPSSKGLRCVAVDTMELFTAVQRSAEFQAELQRVRREIWPEGAIPIDLFMESERLFGIKKLPTLVLLDKDGVVKARFDGPLKDPPAEIERAIADFVRPWGE
jgi:thiol-disulfide isomerase/thioredoxin